MHVTIFQEKSSCNLVKLGPLLLVPFAYHRVYFVVLSEAGFIPGNVHSKMLIPGVEIVIMQR